MIQIWSVCIILEKDRKVKGLHRCSLEIGGMNRIMKRVLTIQDISCLGKCSLTVALPVISAAGSEAVILPTAVLSTHTMFQGGTFRDLTEDILPITSHWKKEQIQFDGIYTGYLGSIEQVELILQIMAEFGQGNTVKIVDPAMADSGKLYTGFNMTFVEKMKELCGAADVVLPNITEAAFMTGLPYKEDYREDYIEELLLQMSVFCKGKIGLTGVSFGADEIGVMVYDTQTGTFFQYFTKKYPVAFHGTGDIFASTVTGALIKGKTIEDAFAVAVDFTAEIIRVTLENPNHRTYGVDFETALPYLWKRLSIDNE